MAIEHWLAFNLALLAAIVSPGPALLMAVRTTLGSGRAAGIAMGCGLGSMAAIWTLLALLGLESMFRLFPWIYLVAKLLGAAYLLYLAWRIWTRAGDAVQSATRRHRLAFRAGFMVNLLNPKSVLFAAAVLVVIFPPGLTAVEFTLVVVNHWMVEIVFYSILAWVMSSAAAGAQYLRARRHIDRVSAVVLGALGLRLLFER